MKLGNIYSNNNYYQYANQINSNKNNNLVNNNNPNFNNYNLAHNNNNNLLNNNNKNNIYIMNNNNNNLGKNINANLNNKNTIKNKNNAHPFTEANNSLNQGLTQSVFDLVNCFICLCPAENPMSCPKCNHFCCRKCFDKFFESETTRKCPICKQDISKNEITKNNIIQDIENIINKNENNKQKAAQELTKLLNEKKKEWEGQYHYLNKYIETVYRYLELFKNYKNSYMSFLAQIEKYFNDYQKKIEQLLNYLKSYNTSTTDSINKYNNFIKKSQMNFYTNKNVKDLINEILDTERKYFNQKFKKNKEEINIHDIKLEPKFINLIQRKNLDCINNNSSALYAVMGFICDGGIKNQIGEYEVDFSVNSFQLKYNFDIKISVKMNKDWENSLILVNQKIEFDSKIKKFINFKLVKHENSNYEFKHNFQMDMKEIKELQDSSSSKLFQTEFTVFKI